MKIESAEIPVSRLALLAVATVAVHGYHLGADDAAIYIPGIKQVFDPSLYPFGSAFFLSHAHLSLFSNLIGGSARLAHLPIDPTMLAWHAVSILLLLAAGWRVASACFEAPEGRWGAVLLLAATLSVPVAGTALMLMDPYLTARSLSTPLALFAVASCVARGVVKLRWETAMWLLLTALIHVQMTVYAVAFIAALWLAERLAARSEAAGGLAPALAALPFFLDLSPARGPAGEALHTRTFFFVSGWAWYEWVGVIAPLVLAWLLSRVRWRRVTPMLALLLRTLLPFGAAFTLFWLALSVSPRLENLTRLQPMRALHILYLLFFLLTGGLLGQMLLRRTLWRWLALFVPLGAGMWMLQNAAYAHSPHVEWTERCGGNAWLEAFYWIRHNTPHNAVFALDPLYLKSDGQDEHGFRAVAERSVLADEFKDSGAVSLFPALGEEWKAESQAQTGIDRFDAADLQRLSAIYPVDWAVLRLPAPAGLSCPYHNARLAVCRIERVAPPVARMLDH